MRAATAVERSQALVSAFRAAKLPTSDQATGPAYANLDGFFDFDRLIDATIAPYRPRFKAEQLKLFKTQFREVIRLVAYRDAAKAFSRTSYTLQPLRDDGKQADVGLTLNGSDHKPLVNIQFRWARAKRDWRIYDILFDGSSLVGNYREQFGRILREGPPEHLLSKLERRLSEERRGKGDRAVPAPAPPNTPR